MRRQRFGAFTGGIDLRADKDDTRDEQITPICPAEALRVPIDPALLGHAKPLVAPGDTIQAGQRIALAGGRMPILAPSDGVVGAVQECVLAGAATPRNPTPTIEITQPTAIEPWSTAMPEYAWRPASADELLDKLRESGVTTCEQRPGILAEFCDAAIEAKTDALIANGLENQPHLTAKHRTLREFGADAMQGLAILRTIIGAKQTTLAVDSRLTDSYRSVVGPAEDLDIEPVAVAPKYPVDHPAMLTRVVTNRKVRPGESTLTVGVGVVNIAACLATYHAIACDRPATQTVVTVAGLNVNRPGNYLAPFGTPIDDLLTVAEASPNLPSPCHNGPMTGATVEPGAVVGPGTAAVLSLAPYDQRRATACIRCAWCTDHCPVRLDVTSLNDMYELGQLDRAARYDVAACLGCGVCSYICPAHLPLTYRVMQLKQAVTERRP